MDINLPETTKAGTSQKKNGNLEHSSILGNKFTPSSHVQKSAELKKPNFDKPVRKQAFRISYDQSILQKSKQQQQ